MKQLYSLIPFYIVAIIALPVDAAAVSVQINVTHDETCSNANGSIEVQAYGGTAPYNYLWTPTPANGQGTPSISGLVAGIYTLVVTDALADQASTTITLGNLPYLEVALWPAAQDLHGNCPGHCWGEFRVIDHMFPGTPPYTYDLPILGYDLTGFPFFQVPGGACGGDQYSIVVTDANGCSGTLTGNIIEPNVGSPPLTITNVGGACSGLGNGSISFTNVYDGTSWWFGPELKVYDSNGFWVNGQANAGLNATITGLSAGHYVLQRDWNTTFAQYTAYPCDDDTMSFDIPDLGAACGTLSGKVYIDNDQDCVQDAGEVGVPYSILEILPGPQYAITNSSGSYSRSLVDASYTLGQLDPTLVPICPTPQPVAFIMNSLPVVIDLADSSTVPLDLQVTATASAARPGFAHTYFGRVRNLSPQITGPVTITASYDPAFTFVTAVPAQTSTTGNNLVWNLPALPAYGQYNVRIDMTVPASTVIGSSFTHTLYSFQTLPEVNTANNTVISSWVVTGSYDPNDKQVATSSGYSDDIYFIGTDQWLDYTIRFQNTGTDTAFTVVVSDTLDPILDITSYEQGIAAHPFNVQFLPDRVVKWTFDNILLPDSNTNEVASHGLVTFRIRPVDPLAVGTVISNNADIFFDFNTPIRTNDVIVTAEISTAIQKAPPTQLAIRPNPSNGNVRLSLPANSTMMTSIEVADVHGKVIQRISTSPTTSISLALEYRSSGVYFVRAICVNGSVLISRIVIQ